MGKAFQAYRVERLNVGGYQDGGRVKFLVVAESMSLILLRFVYNRTFYFLRDSRYEFTGRSCG